MDGNEPDRKTAKELMEELARDKDYQAKRSKAERRRRRRKEAYERAMEPTMARIRQAGYAVDNLEDLVEQHAPLDSDAITILLDALSIHDNPDVLEAIVRALAASGERFSGRPLMDLLESTDSDSLRWAIANTVFSAEPTGVENRLINAVRDKQMGRAREMLVLAAPRILPSERARALVRASFEDLPGHAAKALAQVGNEDDLERLRARRANSEGWVKEEIEKAISAIANRIE